MIAAALRLAIAQERESGTAALALVPAAILFIHLIVPGFAWLIGKAF